MTRSCEPLCVYARLHDVLAQKSKPFIEFADAGINDSPDLRVFQLNGEYKRQAKDIKQAAVKIKELMAAKDRLRVEAVD